MRKSHRGLFQDDTSRIAIDTVASDNEESVKTAESVNDGRVCFSCEIA